MSQAGMQALSVSGVHKRFGNVEALRGVNLSVEQGEIFGFLGPNGAGKTTTIRVLTGFIRADQGAARVLGMESWSETVAIKAKLGFLPDVVAFASGLTGQDFLNYVASLRGIRGKLPRQAELLERLELPDSALRRKVKGYSSGMAKKLGLVQAMQHDPDVLIMDEPTEALDPLMRSSCSRLSGRRRTEARRCSCRRTSCLTWKRCVSGWRSSATAASSGLGRWKRCGKARRARWKWNSGSRCQARSP